MTREEDLLKRIAQEDPGAMDELIALYYPDILRYCLWRAPNRFWAEDAVQETFIRFIRFFDSYTHRGKFRAFLYQIAANTCVDMRRKKWMAEIPVEKAGQELACPEELFDEIQEDLYFRGLIRGLEDQDQEIVLLRFAQDLTLREIARVTGLPLRTVQSRLRRALKKMKNILEKGDAD